MIIGYNIEHQRITLSLSLVHTHIYTGVSSSSRGRSQSEIPLGAILKKGTPIRK